LRLEDVVDKYRVKPGTKVKLSAWDPDDTREYAGEKKDADRHLEQLSEKLETLETLQELLYAEHKHKLLIVLQAMDTGGKDGTIRHVFRGVDPLGVRVVSFKVPTPEEVDHDFLWRVHKQVPAHGELVIFNRSHYEDVLIVRVHNLVPPEVWGRRYDQINNFERMLVEEGTTILKFYLHISKEEQKRRLLDRVNRPDKYWKFNPEDLNERRRWNEYMQAYEDALSKTSTPLAPWYIVPANHKWYRNLVVATTINTALEGLGMKYPEAKVDMSKILIE
jgi:PPK2 family polyphosphate:nucleotide phosphotransferase